MPTGTRVSPLSRCRTPRRPPTSFGAVYANSASSAQWSTGTPTSATTSTPRTTTIRRSTCSGVRPPRSEERRVGKECNARCADDQEEKKRQQARQEDGDRGEKHILHRRRGY